MKAVEVLGQIDAKHHIQATVPDEVLPGPVRLIVLIPEEAETTTDALTAAMNAVCAEVNTSLDHVWASMTRQGLERSEW